MRDNCDGEIGSCLLFSLVMCAKSLLTVCLDEVDKMSKKMEEVKGLEIPVVGEAFLEDAGKGGALLKIPSHTISPWGAPRHSLSSATEDTDSASAFKSAGTLIS